MKNLLFALAAMAAMAALGACATGASLSDNQRLAVYRAHAGAPVKSFHYFGNLHGWDSLGDSALVIWDRPNRAYLLTLAATCPQLDFAHAISFSGFSSQSGSVYAGFDDVVILDRQTPSIPCRIQQIQPVDTRAIKQAEKDARAAAQASADES